MLEGGSPTGLLADGWLSHHDMGEKEAEDQVSAALSRLVDAWAQGEVN